MLDDTLQQVQTLLDEEQEAGRVCNSLDDLQVRQERRAKLTRLINTIDNTLSPVRAAIQRLPSLPVETQIMWAQSIRAMPNLVFLELDSTGLNDDDDLIRAFVLDRQGHVQLDVYVQTQKPLSAEVARINGIRPEDLEGARSLEDAWVDIACALQGKYAIWFGDYDPKLIERMTRRYGLPPLVLVGDDLQKHVTQYYHKTYGWSIAKLSEHMGYPLEELPTAIDRARAQMHILDAISRGVTDVRPPREYQEEATPVVSSSGDDDLGDLDDHPF